MKPFKKHNWKKIEGYSLTFINTEGSLQLFSMNEQLVILQNNDDHKYQIVTEEELAQLGIVLSKEEKDKLLPPKTKIFEAMIYYHDGFGPKFKKIEFESELENAKQQAIQLADKIIGKEKWIEVKLLQFRVE